MHSAACESGRQLRIVRCLRDISDALNRARDDFHYLRTRTTQMNLSALARKIQRLEIARDRIHSKF